MFTTTFGRETKSSKAKAPKTLLLKAKGETCKRIVCFEMQRNPPFAAPPFKIKIA